MLSLLIISCILSGILGRLGGWEHGNRLYRILGVPAVACLTAILSGTHSLWLILTFGWMAGAISTYWDFVPFWMDKDNFFMHGFFLGLSLLPLAFPNHWLGFGSAVILYTLWMGLWSKLTHRDVLEEFGRYAVIPFGVWLLLK